MSSFPEEDAGELPEPDLEELQELNAKDEDELSDAEVTSKIKLSVKRRFDYPTWLVVFEFQNRDQRRADCLAFNTRASRNFPLVGFEFKASRSDWLAEKKNHEKADFFVQLCDEWYVVAGRRGIVEESELPDGWGLLELKPSGQLWKLVDSDLGDLQDRRLDRRFFARFMKKTIGNESNFGYEDVREAQRRGYDEAMDKAVEDTIDREAEKLQRDAENWRRLRDAGLGSWTGLTDKEIERMKAAERVVQAIEGDRHGTLMGQLESFERELVRDFGRLYEDTATLQERVEAIRETMPGGDQE